MDFSSMHELVAPTKGMLLLNMLSFILLWTVAECV